MSIGGVLARGRAAALNLMRDTCTVERKAGSPVLDDATGQLVQTWVTIHTGPCRLKSPSRGGQTSGSETEWGEREVTLHRYMVVFPWDVSDEIQRGDRLTVTNSADAWLIGRPLEVIDIGHSGTSTARRILVEDREG